MIPKSPSTKSKTYLVMCLDTQLSPTKKCFVPNVDVLDFVGEIFGGINFQSFSPLKHMKTIILEPSLNLFDNPHMPKQY